jgi:hypothetical protein
MLNRASNAHGSVRFVIEGSKSAMTRRDVLDRLIEEARKDPQFFHDLVFKPEAVIARLDYLDRREKGMIVGIAPEDVIAGLAGLFVNPGGTVAECGGTCGSGSCTNTCDSSCGDTCRSSCDSTCGSASCGKTSSRDLGEVVSQPWETAFGGGRAFFRPMRRTDR